MGAGAGSAKAPTASTALSRHCAVNKGERAVRADGEADRGQVTHGLGSHGAGRAQIPL